MALTLLLFMLLEVVIIGTAAKIITVTWTTDVEFSCSTSELPVTWQWVPQSPKCADIKGPEVTIYSSFMNGTHRVDSQRFRNRLQARWNPEDRNYSLFLRDAAMSDSGRFICKDAHGPKEIHELFVVAGCEKRVFEAKYNEKKPSVGGKIILHCSPCTPKNNFDVFDWSFNGSLIYPSNEVIIGRANLTILKLSEDHEGKWRCQKRYNVSHYKDYCLHLERGFARQQNSLIPSTPPDTSKQWSLNMLFLLIFGVSSGIKIVILLLFHGIIYYLAHQK